MTSHKSPSSVRWAAQRERREILETRRATAISGLEGTQYHFAVALPKHPKAGRILSNSNSNRTLTGKVMQGNRFDYRKVVRTIERPLGKMNWELLSSQNRTNESFRAQS